LTLILAATPSLGIGKSGGLPWPQLKKEMGYFARVTKRVSGTSSSDGRRKINAVIMGRKTWDSIPTKFRPLKDRVNVVITRSPETAQITQDVGAVEGPVVASSISEALERSLKSVKGVQVEKVFVIGGASLYNAALELRQANRVLLTKIREDFECDTHFGLDLDGEEGRRAGWRRKSREELREFTGEEDGKLGGEDGVLEEGGVKFEFCLYQRD
ncbi:dihydrofolate reductase-like domain-containing protein, partial [Lophiotrema nucula]